ncbi:MAG: DUF4491 family protein [Lachnospiraceae bacterium]|nr:DUF4491 family protein [Lachnospiraceae bacterium]
MYLKGLIVGIATFLLIGIFHPIVIKAEYYFTKKVWPVFLVCGIVFLAVSLFISNVSLSCISAVCGITWLWGIGELFEQEERVRKGWFPKNPKREYPKEANTANAEYGKN